LFVSSNRHKGELKPSASSKCDKAKSYEPDYDDEDKDQLEVVEEQEQEARQRTSVTATINRVF